MAAAAASLATKDVGDSIMVDAKNHNKATIVAECTQAPSTSACIAERLFNRLPVRLEEEQLSFVDLLYRKNYFGACSTNLDLQVFWIAEHYARIFMRKCLNTQQVDA